MRTPNARSWSLGRDGNEIDRNGEARGDATRKSKKAAHRVEAPLISAILGVALEGRILAGRYRLVSPLGRGGMGAVWRAEHIDLGTPAAVKLIDETFAQSPEALTRFRREAQAAASLRSANVVQILDYGVDGDTPYIAMELLEGESLADRIERQGRLDPDECAGIMLQVSKALARAHEQGIVHRDLKPDNVFLSRDGDDVIAKVLDFGIAKRTGVLQTSSDMATRTGSLMGTPYYMSPEQASGRRQVDHRTDIWAFGVIACECLTGRRPFDDSNLGGLLLSICTENPPAPSQVAPVPLGFDTWFARCTVKDPAGRFESIREAAVELCRSVGSDATASRFSASR
ncbi:MAG TPA: serine/threonine-protein kinase, partial [Polyangiaceae bacterium]|nr:serine/threonine-protein kinase [Polyangiaceae bacterium]